MAHVSENTLIEKLKNATQQVVVGGVYQHYYKVTAEGVEMKYLVTGLAIQEEDESVRVLYQALYGDKVLWSRSLEKFTEIVEVDGKQVPRFTLLNDKK